MKTPRFLFIHREKENTLNNIIVLQTLTVNWINKLDIISHKEISRISRCGRSYDKGDDEWNYDMHRVIDDGISAEEWFNSTINIEFIDGSTVVINDRY